MSWVTGRALFIALPLVACLGYAGYSLAQRQLRDELTVGREAVRAGKWDAAEAAAARLDRAGRADDARLLRGLARVEQARQLPAADQPAAVRPALAQLSRVRSPGRVAEATVLAAECLVRLGELRPAEVALQTILRSHPDEPEAHRWLGAVYVDLNAPVSAAHHLAEWGRLDPSAGAPYRWAGFFQKTVDNPARAVECYRSALGRPLDDALRAEVARELAEVLLDSLQDHRGALEALDRAPPTARGRPAFQVLRASALWGLGRHDEAVAAADEAVRADPRSAAALRVRAQFHLQRDDPRAARPLLERAAELAPHDLGILKDLTDACEQAGDAAAAAAHRKAFERTTALRERMTRLYAEAERRPWDPAPRREAAEVCRELRRPDEARMWAKAAVAAAPGDPAARDLLAALGGPNP
jgi:tetratricopeptide (TPR) repeat protein